MNVVTAGGFCIRLKTFGHMYSLHRNTSTLMSVWVSDELIIWEHSVLLCLPHGKSLLTKL